MFITIAGVLIIAHSISYLFWIRHRPWGRTEIGIFAYHALSFFILMLTGLIILITHPEEDVLAGAIAGVSLHAIYSMTFLEFWSLSQGSFSYAVLSRLNADGRSEEDIISALKALSESKKSNRIGALADLALVKQGSDGVRCR